MKKRTKTALRTKIYLALVALLTLTGALYAFPANPFTFSVFPQITGLAATKSELFATGYVTNPDIYSLDCLGIPTVYQAAPIGEKYLTIAPAQSANAGFTPRDVFVTLGQGIYRATPPGPFTLFTTVPCSGGEVDHTGITFDHTGPPGTFGNDMIVTCQEGDVFKVDNLPGGPHVTFLAHASNNGEIEGPVVAPLTFGPFGGQILVADEGNGEVNAINNDGPPATVTHNIFNWPGDFEPSPEALTFVPQPQDMCTYCGFAFFQSSQQNPAGAPSIFAYPPSDFNGLGGSLLVTLESNQRIALVQFLAGNYSTTVFDNPPGSNILEGNSFVDCSVPTPTPTSTPTSTSTPTATFTPTATATFTPTATATFTPTPTATFTPTATATFTPTPTPTSTPGLLCPAGSFEGGNTGGNAAGDISIAYSQFPAPNDNSYGTNAVGWPSGHTFNNLTGSDKAGFQILRPNGTIAVSFNIDYISASTLNSPPSGYQSLGPFGGDGGIVVNSTPALVNNGTQITWDTSFARDLNGPAVWGPSPTWPTPTYFVGGVQTIGTAGTNSAILTTNSPPVDCSMANAANCIIQYGVPKGIQYPLAVPNPWTASYNNPEYTTSGGPIPTGPNDPAHVDGWNFQDMFFVTFKAAYLTALGFDFSNYDIADFDPATNTFTCDPNKWCIAPNPTALHNSPAKPCPSVSPSPSPTPTPCVCGLTVTNRAVSSDKVRITIQNNGCADEFITNIALSWPQGTNGNLQKIKLGGDTLWNGPATGSPINFGIPPLTADANKRKIKKGTSEVLEFDFVNNAAPLNNAAYSGSADFQSQCHLDLGLPTP